MVNKELVSSYVGQDSFIIKDGPRCSEFIEYLYKPFIRGDADLDSINEQGTKLFDQYKRVLYNIANFVEAKAIVELGVREARSSDAFTRVVSKRNGMVYSFDPTPVENIFITASYRKYWQFHPLTGEDGYEQFGDKIKDFDMLYIDTDPHSREQMDMWLSNYWIHNISKGGYIVADDTAPQYDELIADLEFEGVTRTVRDYGVFSSLLNYVLNNNEKIEYAFSVYNNQSNGFSVIKLV
jgi:hypothetical protein